MSAELVASPAEAATVVNAAKLKMAPPFRWATIGAPVWNRRYHTEYDMARQCLDRRIPDRTSRGGRQQPGKLSATETAHEWTGASPPQMHVSG